MKNNAKKIFIIFISIIFSGCKGYYDITDYNIISGIYLDITKDNKIMVSCENIASITSSEGNEPTPKTTISTFLGESIYHAFRKGALSSHGKKNFYPSIRVVILSKEYAEKGIEEAVDFFIRDPKRRNNAYFIISDKKDYNLFNNKNTHIDITSDEIFGIIKQTKLSGYGVDTKLYEFIKETNSNSGVGILNIFALKPKTEAENIPENKGSKDSSADLQILGTGVLYKYKLLGLLDINETLAVNIIRDKIHEGVYVLQDENPKNKITVKLRDPKVTLMPEVTDGNHFINVDIKSTSEIVEYSNEESLKTIDLIALENRISQELNREILKTFDKAKKEFKVDIFDFGGAFERKYPQISKLTPEEWNKIFVENLGINLNTKLTVTDTNGTNEKIQ